MKKLLILGLVVLGVLLGGRAWGQTNPTAQSLPYSQSFGTTTFTSMPTGMASWNGLDGDDVSTQTLAENSVPVSNAALSAATATTTTGGTFGYSTSSNGRPYIQHSGNATNGANQLALAIVTTGKQDITLVYDVEIISAQPRTVGIVMQYRVGTSGSWTTVTGTGNPFSQAGGTTGVKASPSIVLPAAANNQPVVQIRWATWRGTETGGSSGIAIDNISVIGSALCTPPSQATAFSPSNIQSTQMDISWTAGGSGSSTLVVARAGSAVNADPVFGTGYTANAAFSSGAQIGTGNYVVYNGTGTSVTVTGLTANTTYHYAIYSYSGASGSECYNTTELTGSATTPILNVSTATLTGFTYINGAGPSTSQSFNLSGSNLTGAPGNITVTGSTDYEVSSDDSAFGASATVPYAAATLSSTPVYVRLKAGLATGAYNSQTISISGGGATQSVTCSGTVTNPANVTHTGTSPAAANVYQGTLDNILYKVQLDVTNIPTTLSQVVATTSGTWDNDDISNIKLRYSTDATLSGGDATLATISAGLTGGGLDLTFNGFSQVVPVGTVYLFITADVSATATLGNTLTAAVDADGDLTYTASTTFSGSTFAAGNAITVIGQPEIQLEWPVGTNLNCGGTVAFGNVAKLTSSTQTIRVRNLGNADLNITNLPLIFTGTGAADYSFTTALTSPIAPGAYADMVVSVTPSAAGTRSAAISISDNDLSEGTCAINFTATGTEPEIQLKVAGTNRACGYTYSFGTVNVGASSVVTMTIQNLGAHAPLNLTTLPFAISGPNAAEFSITTTVTSPIVAGASLDFVVQFSPTSAGAKTAKITIESNDSNESPCEINLSATGFQPYYFRTKQSGSWSDATTWETSVNQVSWADAAAPPATTDLNIQITSPNNITLSTTVSVDQLVVETGSVLEVTGTLTIADGTGTDLLVKGILKNSTNSAFTINSGAVIVVDNGGRYQHNPTGGGSITTMTWNTGSTCEIIKANATPGGLTQNFYNFTWASSNQNAVTINLSGDLETVNGDFSIEATGTSALRLTGSTANTLTVAGNVTIASGATLDLGNGGAISTMNVGGNLSINGGTLTLMGTGSSNGFVNLSGNLNMTGGTITEGGSGTGHILTFNGSTAQTATFGTVSNDVSLAINNAAGLTLLSDALSFKNMTFTSGQVRTNGNTIAVTGTITGASSSMFFCTCDATGGTTLTAGGLRHALPASTTYQYPVGPTSAYYMPATLISTAGHTGDNFTVRVETLGEGGVTPTDATKCIQYQWNINEAIAGGSLTQLKLQWAAGTEGSNFVATNAPHIGHWNGSIFSPISTATYTMADPSFLSSTNFTSFSPFVVASEYGALPVELLSFNATKQSNHSLLTFATASERNNERFEIERSADGRTFQVIGVVKGAGDAQTQNNYTFTDEHPLRGINYYRLRQVDVDGASTLSQVVSVTFGKTGNVVLYPTPANETMNVRFDEAFTTDANWQIVDLTGRILNEGIFAAEQTEFRIPVASLTQGAYILRVTANNEVVTQQFRKQ